MIKESSSKESITKKYTIKKYKTVSHRLICDMTGKEIQEGETFIECAKFLGINGTTCFNKYEHYCIEDITIDKIIDEYLEYINNKIEESNIDSVSADLQIEFKLCSDKLLKEMEISNNHKMRYIDVKDGEQ